VRPLDDFSDIPLTQEQRKLLGLPETPGSASPANETFATPPRYAKSTPPSRTASPLYSTPTMQRNTAGGRDFGSSEMSMGTPSPLSTPLRAGLRPLWDSPRSPKTGSAASITPSNRWAYEKSILARKGTFPAEGRCNNDEGRNSDILSR
jgi:nucleoporin POM34